MRRVLIKSEVVEFGTLPIGMSVTLEQLIKGFAPYLNKSDTKISLEEIFKIMTSMIQNLNEKDVSVLFTLYKVIVEGDIGIVSASMKRKDFTSHVVKARPFCIFLYLQGYRTSTANARRDMSGGWVNQEGMVMGQGPSQYSPMSSPRGKGMRTSTIDAIQSLVSYIKSNLPIFVKIACGITSFKSKDSFPVSSEDFENLSVIFTLTEDKDVTLTRSLSDLFSGEITSTALMSIIEKHLSTADIDTTISLYNIRKCVTIKDQSFCKKPILKIHNCEDSFIYINAAVDFVSITNCVNCTIFVAAVKKICAVEKSDKLSFTSSSNIIRIGNTIDSTLYSYSTCEPILFGDNKMIVLGPNNANYFEMLDKLKRAGISLSMKSLAQFSFPITFHHEWYNPTSTFSLLNKKDFSALVLPDEFLPVPMPLSTKTVELFSMEKAQLASKCMEGQKTIIVPFMAPQDYKNVIIDRENKSKMLREKVAAAGLTKDQALVLANAIQGHFKEWLLSKPEHKEILDIVYFIDKDL